LREASARRTCEDHLRRIGVGFAQYRNDNNYRYPRTVVQDGANGFRAFTGTHDGDPFTDGPGEQVQANDVTGSLWLLVHGGYNNDTNNFICPGTWDTPDPVEGPSGRPVSPKQRGNFAGPNHLSYSYANPFSTAPGYELDDVLPGSFAIMADMNPGTLGGDGVFPVGHDATAGELAAGNSFNHNRAGQNVLFSEGSVYFVRSPFVGVARTSTDDGDLRNDGDNIYTAMAADPVAAAERSTPTNTPGVLGPTISPSYSYDSFLVPFEE
jgi:hypothetical protein